MLAISTINGMSVLEYVDNLYVELASAVVRLSADLVVFSISSKHCVTIATGAFATHILLSQSLTDAQPL